MPENIKLSIRARLQYSPQLKLFGAATENGYAVGASTGCERMDYMLKVWERKIFWWLPVYAFANCFLDFSCEI